MANNKRITIRKRHKKKIDDIMRELFQVADKTEIPPEEVNMPNTPENRIHIAVQSGEGKALFIDLIPVLEQIYKDNIKYHKE